MLEPAVPTLDAPALVRYGLPAYTRADQPAAGAHFTQAIDGSHYVRLVSVFCRLVASAVVASREVILEYRDAEDNRYALHGSATAQTASQTRDYYFAAFQPVVLTAVDSSHLIPLSPTLLPPTHDFRIFVLNIDVGDQLSRIRIVAEKFYTTHQPPTDFPH